MNLDLTKDNAELLIILCLVGAIPASFFMPGIPTILIFMYAGTSALLIYTLYQLTLLKSVIATAKDAVAALDSLAEQQAEQESITAKWQGGATENATHIVNDQSPALDRPSTTLKGVD